MLCRHPLQTCEAVDSREPHLVRTGRPPLKVGSLKVEMKRMLSLFVG
jgi:hypothetical protein